MEQSTIGEAAGVEIAPLLGMAGPQALQPMWSRLSAVGPDAIVTLSRRDQNVQRDVGVATIADRVKLHGIAEDGDAGTAA